MSIDKEYGFPFAKVHDTRTFVDELQYAKDHFGVYIDIFPLDGVKKKTGYKDTSIKENSTYKKG